MKDGCLCLSSRNAKSLTNLHYTAQDTSKILGLKFTTLLALIKKNKIAARLDGRKLLITRDEISRFAEENKIYLR